MEKKISIAVIKRLPRYYRFLGELLENGITRISSKDLSDKMDVTASQIRQDLSNFGSFGQQGYGYNVEYLHEEIKNILGLNKTYNLIVIGAGNLGQALLNYTNFSKRGFNFIGIFDINPNLVGNEIQGIKIQNMSELSEFLKVNTVDIAVLTVPRNNSLVVSKIIIDNGIKAIWNFSNVELKVSQDIEVENVHLTDSLMRLTYKFNKNLPLM